MTDRIDTAALRRAWGETTQGEWRWHQGHSVCTITVEGHEIARVVEAAYWQPFTPRQAANAHFIALAHREWPALLDRIDALEALAKANNDLARMEVAHRKKLAFQRAELANAMEALTSQYGHRLPADFLLALTQMLMRHGEEARTALGGPS